MLQFYFLSVVLNAFAGIVFFFGEENTSLESGFSFSLKDDTLKFAAGILSAITGLLKILSPIEGDLPVLGDIVPAAVNFLCGFILIFEYYRRRSSIGATEQTDKIDTLLLQNKKIIGFVALAAAALHFLFPKVLLL